jgi:repressor LexA
MTRVPLTRRQRDILEFVRTYVDSNDISPTLEEIARHYGVSRVTIHGHIKELEKKGVLERSARGISRGILLPGNDSNSQEETSEPTLPILGSIAAGNPIEVLETSESFQFSDMLPPGADLFMLKVQGNSMIEDSICNGDMVIIEKTDTARNGQVVVAVLEGNETTLKRYYKEDGRIRLQPANSAMEPIFVKHLEINGVVVGVVRKVH